MTPAVLGRILTDAELANFYGGAAECTVTITVYKYGSTVTEYKGNCEGVEVK